MVFFVRAVSVFACIPQPPPITILTFLFTSSPWSYEHFIVLNLMNLNLRSVRNGVDMVLKQWSMTLSLQKLDTGVWCRKVLVIMVLVESQ